MLAQTCNVTVPLFVTTRHDVQTHQKHIWAKICACKMSLWFSKIPSARGYYACYLHAIKCERNVTDSMYLYVHCTYEVHVIGRSSTAHCKDDFIGCAGWSLECLHRRIFTVCMTMFVNLFGLLIQSL